MKNSEHGFALYAKKLVNVQNSLFRLFAYFFNQVLLIKPIEPNFIKVAKNGKIAKKSFFR